MTDLKLSNRRQPIVTYPSDMFKKHYTGKLVGYYVEDTNFYNVMRIRGELPFMERDNFILNIDITDSIYFKEN